MILSSGKAIVRNTGCIFRFFRSSSDDSKLLEYIAKPPSKSEPAWSRLANKIKSSDEDRIVQKFEMNINDICDRRDHVAKIEDELREEMAKALGKTGRKCVYAFDLLRKAEQQCINARNRPSEEYQYAVKTYNEVREFAENARTELIIHRQAIGLTWRNQKIVEEEFPLPPREF